jgi:predicted DNA-binding protein
MEKAKESSSVDDEAIVPMSLRLSRQLYERLRKFAFDTRKPMNEHICRAIEAMLKAEKR